MTCIRRGLRRALVRSKKVAILQEQGLSVLAATHSVMHPGTNSSLGHHKTLRLLRLLLSPGNFCEFFVSCGLLKRKEDKCQ